MPWFKPSPNWILLFKKKHKIVSRKIIKYVTKVHVENEASLKLYCQNFIILIKTELSTKSASNIYNSNQSGFNLEMHTGRTLSEKEGTLLSLLFMVLKEINGSLDPLFQKNYSMHLIYFCEQVHQESCRVNYFKHGCNMYFFLTMGKQHCRFISTANNSNLTLLYN
ncbi:uncharacterized protein LOC131665452 [Phymastichus coffea]|uniref:uncharacterized protein LOC131665452 n=1 Tax=Phymastichus coffea TaxID=108790 RepID=UPI00273C4AC1|nr:uncharacterized protein LOC131665452 [Phymastichus coffea]